VRVRDLGGGRARVEVGRDEVACLTAEWSAIEHELLALGFAGVAADPRGYRSGALNEGLAPAGPAAPVAASTGGSS
jgi:uncharacterized protein